MHRKNIPIYIIYIYPTRRNVTQFIYIWKLLYMFRVVPSIIRSAYNCIYGVWYLSDRYCYLPLQRQVAVTVGQISDAVDTVVCAPDDGWFYHPKHVEQFPDINKFCKVASCWIYILEYRYLSFYICSACFIFQSPMQEPKLKKNVQILIFPNLMLGCKTWTVTQM